MTGIYAPERAGHVGGALRVMGADAAMIASIESRRRCVCAVWGTISAIVVVPLTTVLTTFEPKVGARDTSRNRTARNACQPELGRVPDCKARSVDIRLAKLYLRTMQTLPIKSERLAELEEFARRRGKNAGDALDDVLAEYLEWERQDYQESLGAVRQGLEDVKAGRTRPANEFLDEFARKHGLPH